jgi:hypothetical protein
MNEIFEFLKDDLIKGASVDDLLIDKEATAWQYAYKKTKDLNDDENLKFLFFYRKALMLLN